MNIEYTYHAVGALGSLDIDAATASARIIGARVHDAMKELIDESDFLLRNQSRNR